jgi:hypothetical protein
MAVSKRLRYEVLRRDNHACRYCGVSAPDVTLTVDHVIPVTLGGTDEPSNLVTACMPCNSGKSASAPDAPIVADVAADALRWAQAMRIAAKAQAITLGELVEYTEAVLQLWQTIGASAGYVPPPPDDWRLTVEQFFRQRIVLSEWRYAMERALLNHKVLPYRAWTYMCGVLWTRLRERVAMAQDLASMEE